MAKKPRKWSNLDGKIPDEPVKVDERELKVRAEMDKARFVETGDGSRPATMRDFALEYASLCEEEAFEDKARKLRSVRYEALERIIRQELAKIQEMAGTDMWRGEGQTFSPKFTIIPVVTDKAALRRWVDDNDMTEMLELPGSKLKEVLTECMDSDLAATMTPAQRAALKPGMPGSMQPPPGVAVFMKKGVNRTET